MISCFLKVNSCSRIDIVIRVDGVCMLADVVITDHIRVDWFRKLLFLMGFL
jgi:hypothetical protein